MARLRRWIASSLALPRNDDAASDQIAFSLR